MNEFKIRLEGAQPLLDQLDGLRHFKAEGIAFENATQIHERASHNKNTMPGGTPEQTGELIKSAFLSKIPHGYYVGYGAEYAPHVEYGHRLVRVISEENGEKTKETIGWVPGQYFFKKNDRAGRPGGSNPEGRSREYRDPLFGPRGAERREPFLFCSGYRETTITIENDVS